MQYPRFDFTWLYAHQGSCCSPACLVAASVCQTVWESSMGGPEGKLVEGRALVLITEFAKGCLLSALI